MSATAPRARRERRERTYLASLPVELQVNVFDRFVWLGSLPREIEGMDEAKQVLENMLVVRLVTQGLARAYLGDMSRINFHVHIKKRGDERDADPNKNQLMRSIFHRCAEAADLACITLYQTMAKESDEAAYVGMKQMMVMHSDQTKAWEEVEKEHPELVQTLPNIVQ